MMTKMYYEEPYERRRRPKRRRRRRGGCLGALLRPLLKLVALAVVLALLAGVILYYLPEGLFMVERGGDLSLTGGLPSSPFNVLLLGVDTLHDGAQRSDTMMIASIDREGVKLTSLQRDVVVEIEGHGRTKLNAAYAYGGPELTMRTVNETFGMNIMRYVVVDFTAVVQLVDALGGIEVDISEDEMRHINKNLYLSRTVFQPLGYTAQPMTTYGENTHLDGLEALAYARIRKLDSDFMRTSRQRTVISAMLERIGDHLYNPVMLYSFVRTAFGCVETNLSFVEMAALGEKALLSGHVEQLRLPVNGTFDDNGSTLTMTDRQANVDKLYQFLYGES